MIQAKLAEFDEVLRKLRLSNLLIHYLEKTEVPLRWELFSFIVFRRNLNIYSSVDPFFWKRKKV